MDTMNPVTATTTTTDAHAHAHAHAHAQAHAALSSIPGLDPLLSIEQLSEYLAVPVKTLYDWRYRKVGPKGMMIGRWLRYRMSDINAWLDSQAA